MTAIEKYIEKITSLNFKDQAFLNRYYARLGLSIQLEIFKRHRKILYMLNQKEDDDISIHIISYIAFVLAIKSYRVDEQRIATKNFDDLDLNEIQKLSTIKVMKYKSKKQTTMTKYSKLVGNLSDIRKAREGGLSLRDLVHYIFKEHEISVKKSTIHTFCKEFNIKKGHK